MSLATELGERRACRQVGLARASFRRRHELVAETSTSTETPASPVAEAKAPASISRQRRRYQERVLARKLRGKVRSPLALSDAERQHVLALVHQPRFVDRSVPYVHATLLDEGTYVCSISTTYRILHSVNEVRERRDQATRPAHVKPELCATAPRQVFAWDITKLHGPQKWTYYYLYVVIDIFSRYVVGWMVADRESSELARQLLQETIKKERVGASPLVLHADRGSSMTSKPVAFMLADLGVTKSHSRPHVSNDNPHIESLFKTVKYQPEFPATFANIQEARAFCRAFFAWYNNEHRHSAIALLTPGAVHHGDAPRILEQRRTTMDAAYARNPERFVKGAPRMSQLADASYINRPKQNDSDDVARCA